MAGLLVGIVQTVMEVRFHFCWVHIYGKKQRIIIRKEMKQWIKILSQSAFISSRSTLTLFLLLCFCNYFFAKLLRVRFFWGGKLRVRLTIGLIIGPNSSIAPSSQPAAAF